ncbi:MAG: Jag N-terminal domain-containing protein, partial [Desulfovibrio sp.]|nr:Jag N-terminal domain-containing protein [Desulfovibrio sp.]
MEDALEFQGKDLTDAVDHACKYFKVPREHLLIEIVRDAKSGIFGVVETRKAAIRAKLSHLAHDTQDKDSHEDLETYPLLGDDQLKSKNFQDFILKILTRLLASIVEEPTLELEVREGKVYVHIECGNDSGLLIGREGQTLIALQY